MRRIAAGILQFVLILGRVFLFQFPPIWKPLTAALSAVSLAAICSLLCQPLAWAAGPLMAIPGQASVTNLGEFTYTVPIQVPPGTHGMAPHLALTYSSSAGDGHLGLGWKISGTSEITRCGQKYATDGAHGGVVFGNGDRFCLDGQELIAINGTYGLNGTEYRTEVDGYRKIIGYTDTQDGVTGTAYFNVQTKDGTLYQYGNTTNSNGNTSYARVFSADGTHVRVWALNQVTDTAGNYMAYTYYQYENAKDYVLASIDYTGNSNNPTYNYVRFSYSTSERPDKVPMYEAGTLIEVQSLLTDIYTYRGGQSGGRSGQLVLDYRLGYTPASSAASHDELNTITLYDSSESTHLPTMTFGWRGSRDNPAINSGLQEFTGAAVAVTPGDFDGDGITDILLQMPESACNTGGNIFLGTGNNNFTSGNIQAKYDEFSGTDNEKTQYSGVACFPSPDSVVADINGDGISDVVIDVSYYENQSHYTATSEVLVNNGSGTLTQKSPDGAYTYPSLLTLPYDDFPSDFNGDGLPDGFGGSSILLGKGDGTFTSVNGFTPPTSTWWDSGDFGGNGCTGLLFQNPYTPSVNNIQTGCEPPSTQSTANFTSYSDNDTYFGSSNLVFFGDFDGDQSTDVIAFDGTSWYLYLSSGTGFNSGIKIANLPNPGNAYSVVTGDWNGDGKTDVAFIANGQNDKYSDIIYLSTGTGFTQIGTVANSAGGNNGATIGDFNSDGATDIWVQCTVQGLQYGQEITFGYVPEQIISVDNGLGVTTGVQYLPINTNGSFYTKGSGATYPTQDVDGPIYAVSQISNSNGIGGTNIWSYSYTGLKKDLWGRGLLSFTTVAVNNHQTHNTRTTTYRTDFPYVGLVKHDQVATSAGVILSETFNTWDRDDPNVCPNPNSAEPVHTVCLETSEVKGTDTDGQSTFPIRTTQFAYDGYGNVLTQYLTITKAGYAQFASDTTNTYNYNDVGEWVTDEPATSKTENTLQNSDITRNYSFLEGNGHTGQITEADIQPNDQQDPTWLQIQYGYDGRGNVNSATYNGWNIVSRTSGVTYDANGEFPVTTTNALGQSESPTFGQLGNLTQLKDLNGNISNWSYDTFDRLQTLTRVDGTTANVNEYYCSSTPYACPSLGAFVVATQYNGATPNNGTAVQNAPSTLVFYDALGRVIAQDRQGFDGSWIQTDTEYDTNGNVAATSQPYITNLGSPQCPTSPVNVCTTYTNDLLGRVTQVTYPNDNNGFSNTYYTYQSIVTIATNDLGQKTTTTQNLAGLTGNVLDNNGGQTLFTYDSFGDLVSVTSPDGTQINNSFDLRGRKVQSTDPDMGTWQYGYDSLGELIAQQDPNENSSNETQLVYDKLGRVLSRTEPDMLANWCYDGQGAGLCNTANAVGLLTEESCTGAACTNGSYTRSYTYDAYSRPSSVSINNGYGTYTSSESYDGVAGTGTQLMTSVTSFSQFQYRNIYNPYGYLCQIVDGQSTNSQCTDTNLVYWQANSMDAWLHLTSETAGNGAVTTHTYWPESGRLENVDAVGGQVTLTNLSYAWDTIGNLSNRTDSVNTYSEYFCYDALNRLENYNVIQGGTGNCSSGGSLQKSISYDQATSGIGDGNISTKSDIGSYSYGVNGGGPHAVSSIATNTGILIAGVANPSFFYDADGNMLCVTPASTCTTPAPARSYAYTSFNMVDSITQGNTNTRLTYDPDHMRGSMTAATTGVTTWYLNNPSAGLASELFEGSGSSTSRDYLAPYGHIVAERFATGSNVSMYYFVGDHLMSTAALSDTTPGWKEMDSYDAWGKRRNASGSDWTNCVSQHPASMTTRGFNGQEELDNYCLVNLNARVLDPSLGRMISADPMVSDATSGQAYNRYAYALNNPLALSDPTGLDTQSACDPSKKIPCGAVGCENNCSNTGQPQDTGMPSSGMPCWYCTGAGLTNDVDGNPVPAANFSGGWNPVSTGWDGPNYGPNPPICGPGVTSGCWRISNGNSTCESGCPTGQPPGQTTVAVTAGSMSWVPGSWSAGLTFMVLPGVAMSGSCDNSGCYVLGGMGEGFSGIGSVEYPLFSNTSVWHLQSSQYKGGVGVGANATIGLPVIAAIDYLFGTSMLPYMEGIGSQMFPGLALNKGPVGISVTGFFNFSGGQINGVIDVDLVPAVGESAVVGVGWDGRN